MIRKLACLAFLAGVLAAGGAEARKVALVIGNERYQHLESLQKAAADAAGYAEVLNAKGFDQVTLKQNLTRDQMDEAIADFVAAIGQGDVAVFVYSGHGWSNGAQNFIIGTDAPATASEERLARIAIPVANGISGIVDEMTRKGASLKVAIVDACRNNPFKPQTAGKAIGFGRGFNRLKEPPPDGTFMVFSAGAGQVALDRLSETDADPHGVFTRTFLPLLKTDLTLLDATKAAQERVYELAKAIGHDQLPAYYDEVRGKACLAGTCEGVATAPAAPVASAPSGDSVETSFWNSIAGSKDPADFKAYLKRFPTGPFADLANNRIAALEPPAPPKPAPPPATPPQPAGCLGGVVASAGGAATAGLTRCLAPGVSFRDCAECPEMVVVAAGRFAMGSPESEKNRDADESPQHSVTIARDFAAGKFEVTRGQFAAFVSDTGHDAGSACQAYENKKWVQRSGRSWRNPGFTQNDTHPVVCVSWDDAKAYVAWLGRRTGETYRLLSEAEWEYAARAGSVSPYASGATITTNQANFDGRSGGKGVFRGKTVAIGSFEENPFGLYDMRGNAWEWVEDCFHSTYDSAPGTGEAWTSGGCFNRVIRGGSWWNVPWNLRAANRGGGTSDDRKYIVGLRVARDLLAK